MLDCGAQACDPVPAHPIARWRPSGWGWLALGAALLVQACATPRPSEGPAASPSAPMTESPTAALATSLPVPEPPSIGATAVITPVVNVLTDTAHAATALAAEVICDRLVPGEAIASLTWTPAEGAAEQRVELTIYDFSGPVDRSAPLGGADQAIEWRLTGSSVRRWRVLSRHDDQWAASATNVFEMPECIGADHAP